MSEPATNLELARSYLQAIEEGATGAGLTKFFAPSVVFEVFPNRLVPQGERQDLKAALAGAERGRKLMANQTYRIKNHLASGSQVALEVEWTGTLAIPFGAVPAGGQLRSNFAVFLDFREGKIVSQRNYDCFDPW